LVSAPLLIYNKSNKFMKGAFGNSLSIRALVLAITVWPVSCKKSFDDPMQATETNNTANTSIAALKSRFTGTGTTTQIKEDIIISGIVNADDKSGNYYQQISIQDTSGGIMIRLAGSDLYTLYPEGRQVYVKMKGLYLGEYGGMIQIGAGEDRSGPTVNVTMIASNLQDNYLVKGPLNQSLTPMPVTVGQLGTGLLDPYVNILVRLDNFEFAGNELGKNYADDSQAGSRIVQGCTAPATNRLTVRTSNYSSFAEQPVAQGNGTLAGIYSVFNSTKQLTIRDTNDVRFYGVRCPTASGSGTIILTASPVSFNFDNIGTAGLPTGVYVKESATTSDLGFEGTVYNGNFNTGASWNNTSYGFKNYASATGQTATTNASAQTAATNRALGVHQTSATGADPGDAVAFLLENTTGKSNLQLTFKLQSLDPSIPAGRTTTWKVDYGIGLNPIAFSTVPTSPASLVTTNGVFSNTTVTVNFGSALNNSTQPVWIRIVALSASTGSGSRASTGIDDVTFTWN
jgi:hypothetical protein